MSSKRVTDFFKQKVYKSSEGVNANLQNESEEQENDPHLNKKQNEKTDLKEVELFHPPKYDVFPRTRMGLEIDCGSNKKCPLFGKSTFLSIFGPTKIPGYFLAI